GTKTRWMRSAVNRPPLPWPSRMCSYCDFGNGQVPKGIPSVAGDRFMSDHVLLAPDHGDQVPENVQQCLVRLLNAMNAEARDREAAVAVLRHPAAVPSGEADRYHAEISSRLQGPVDVGRLAAGREAEGDVAGPAEHANLLQESDREVLVVTHGRQHGGIGG